VAWRFRSPPEPTMSRLLSPSESVREEGGWSDVCVCLSGTKSTCSDLIWRKGRACDCQLRFLRGRRAAMSREMSGKTPEGSWYSTVIWSVLNQSSHSVRRISLPVTLELLEASITSIPITSYSVIDCTAALRLRETARLALHRKISFDKDFLAVV
jgi:hypothetical protein